MIGNLFYTLAIAVFFILIPMAVLAFFVVSLILFIISSVNRKKSPESFDPVKYKKRRSALIDSIVVLAFIIGLYLAVLIVFTKAIAYM